MKRSIVYGTAVVALAAAPLLAQQPAGNTPTKDTQAGSSQQAGRSQSGSVSRADQQFVTKAAQGGLAEVELGRLASQKAQGEQVKQFAQQMITDHGKANEELKSLAQSKNIVIPTQLDSKHKSTHDRLEKLSGAAFDRAYMQAMVGDHREDVNDFRKESQSGQDAEIKAWAAKTLPTLEQHYQLAQQTSRSAVGTSGRSGAASQGDRTNTGRTSGTTGSATSPRSGGSSDASGGSNTPSSGAGSTSGSGSGSSSGSGSTPGSGAGSGSGAAGGSGSGSTGGSTTGSGGGSTPR